MTRGRRVPCLPATALLDHEERGLAYRFAGSPFDPAKYQHHRMLLQAEDIVQDIADQLQNLGLAKKVYEQLKRNLLAVDLAPLQLYYLWISDRGYTELEARPTWRPQRERALAAAGMGMQRAPGGSTRGLDHLLPPGMGVEIHVQMARRLPSPFARRRPTTRTWS